MKPTRITYRFETSQQPRILQLASPPIGGVLDLYQTTASTIRLTEIPHLGPGSSFQQVERHPVGLQVGNREVNTFAKFLTPTN